MTYGGTEMNICHRFCYRFTLQGLVCAVVDVVAQASDAVELWDSRASISFKLLGAFPYAIKISHQ